ncbi:hypothetical protein [Desulfocurvus sp. DL9XJH121]
MPWADPSEYPALTDMEISFVSEGLPVPPVPRSLAGEMDRIDNWHWGTRIPDYSPYDLEHFVREAESGVEPYFLAAHAGHGIQSVALHCYLALPGLACLIQEPWGGAYTNDERAVQRLEQAFALMRQLVERFEGDSSQARRIVIQSSLWPSRLGTATPTGVQWTETPTPFEDALAL